MRKLLCAAQILIWLALSWQGLVLAQEHQEHPALMQQGLAIYDQQRMSNLSEVDQARLRWKWRQQRLKRDRQEKRLKQRSVQEMEANVPESPY